MEEVGPDRRGTAHRRRTHWGLVAIARFDLVAALSGLDFGETNALTRIVYGLVGLSAVYVAAQLRAIARRWATTAPAAQPRWRPEQPGRGPSAPTTLPRRNSTAMPSARTALIPRILTAAALLGTFALAACGSTDTSSNTAPATPAPATSSPPAAAAAGGPFGPACAGVPASGPGSLAAIANEPVATAASQNPALSTLVTAVKAAGLVDTLNNAQAITVFAPTNDAFAKIPKDTLDKVLADKQALTNILTYHVVRQRQSPPTWTPAP